MPYPLRFEVKVAPDYFLLCPFEELDLRVQSEPWVLADELVHGLRDFGPFHQGLVTVQPATPGTLSSVQVLVTRTDLRAAVTFRADRLEIMTLQSQPQPDDASRLVLALLEEPWSSRPFSCSELSVTTSCHGLVEGGAAEFLSGFTGKVPDLGPFAGAGIKLRYGPVEARLRSSVDLDLSGALEDGLYLRMDASWDPQGVSLKRFGQTVVDYQQGVFDRLGLRPEASSGGAVS